MQRLQCWVCNLFEYSNGIKADLYNYLRPQGIYMSIYKLPTGVEDLHCRIIYFIYRHSIPLGGSVRVRVMARTSLSMARVSVLTSHTPSSVMGCWRLVSSGGCALVRGGAGCMNKLTLEQFYGSGDDGSLAWAGRTHYDDAAPFTHLPHEVLCCFHLRKSCKNKAINTLFTLDGNEKRC